MFGKRLTTITREGWYYLVVLAFISGGAVLREINLLFILVGMMFGPLLFNWRAVVGSLRRLTFQRRLPEGICAGDLLVVEVESHNQRRNSGSWALVVEDRIQREGGARDATHTSVEILFPHIPASSVRRTSYRGRLLERGRYRFGPLRVSTSFPLGMLRRIVTIDEVDTLIVCPRLGRLMPNWQKLFSADQVGSRGSQRRQGLIEGDYYGLRDWRSGDSRRWIHWRTSARRGNLAVRQFEQQRSQDTALVLDLWQDARPTRRQLATVERAVRFAATVVADLCRRQGSRLQVAATGTPTLYARGTASSGFMQEVMESLAVIQAGERDDLSPLLARLLGRVAPNTRIILISTRSVDLTDTDRFAEVWDDPRKRSLLGRIACINAGGDELSQYFQDDDDHQLAARRSSEESN